MGKQSSQFPLDVMFLRRSFWTRTAYVVLSVVRLGQLGFNPHQGQGFSDGSQFQTGLRAHRIKEIFHYR